jgi:hypothetical protein
MDMMDKDGDGQLSKEEYVAAPGLAYCASEVDSDKSGTLSRDEIKARIDLYRELRTGYKEFSCSVAIGTAPLANAKIRLVPEPFLGEGIIDPASAITDIAGRAILDSEGADDIPVPVVRVGMYRVEITSDKIKVPAKYNTETTIGVEIPPITDVISPSGVSFRLTK